MSLWKIALVQMDCAFADPQANLQRIEAKTIEAAQQGARLVVFPECILTGYGFSSLEEALRVAETIPGPSTKKLSQLADQYGISIVYGMLECDSNSTKIFNSAALVGPHGLMTSYRKVHLPILGVDRFTTPGDRPFDVHDLGGLKIGINICYDGSFPESSRILTLLGADLILLPTNWPTGARGSVLPLSQARAIENHIYYAACNRVGEERGFRYIGSSRLVEYTGTILATAENQETILYGEIDPEKARQKQVVIIPQEYEVNRVGHRRPEMYGPLVK